MSHLRARRFILCSLISMAAPGFAEEKVTYVDQVLPILRNACLNCHNPDKKKAGLDMTTYAGTMAGSENGPILKPGQPDGSLLYKVCLQTEDPKMPPKGDKLTDAELAVLKNWITGFALETATSKPAAVQNQVTLAVVSLEKPAGPPPMPGDLPLEPYVRTKANNPVTALAVSPWAPLVAIGGQKQVTLYNTETLQPVGVLPFPEGFPQIIRFSRNGQLLLIGGGLGGKSGKVSLWNVVTGQKVGTVGDEVDQVLAADLSPDQGFVALGGPTKTLKIFSTKDGKLLHTLKKHTDWVTAIAFSPDGKFLASADRNGGVMVWEGATGKEYNPLPGHKQMVTALAFMPGILASASTEGKITLWDVKEAKEIRTWTGHNGGVEWIDFTPDGRLVSCGRDKVAKVWDGTGKQVGASAAFGDIALRAGLSHDRIIATDWTGQVKVCKTDGAVVGDLTANPLPIADQLAAAEKRLADAKAAVPAAQQVVTTAEQKVKAEKEAAETKRKTELAAAQKAQVDAQKALDASKTQVAALEKKVADVRGEQETIKKTIETANRAADAAKKIAAEKKAANAADLAASEQDVATKAAVVAEGQKKAQDAQARLTQAQADHAKAAGALPKTVAGFEKAIADAKKRVAELNQPVGPVIDQTRLAAAQKKVDGLNAEVAKRREARGKLKEGTPEYKKADDLVQGIKPELTKAEQELAEAKKPIVSAAEQELAKAKTALEQANAAVASAAPTVEHWRRAQAFMGVHRAENSYAELKSKHEELIATAKDAYHGVEQVRAQIAALTKSTADAPAKLAKAQAEAAAAAKALDVADKAHTSATNALKDKQTAASVDPKAVEGEIAAAQKKLDALNAELTKRREAVSKTQDGSEDRKKADAQVTTIQPEIAAAQKLASDAKAKLADAQAKRTAVTAAEEANKKAEDAENAAHEKSLAADKALAKLKQTSEAEAKQLAELQAKEPKMAQDAAIAKTKAEQEAATIAKQIDQAKAEATRMRAEFEAKWHSNRQASVN